MRTFHEFGVEQPSQTGGPGVHGSPSMRAVSGWKAILEGPEWSVGPSIRLEVFGRPSRRSGSHPKVHQDVWEWSGGPHCRTGVVGGPPGAPPHIPTTPDHYHPTGRASEPLLALREGLLTIPGYAEGPTNHSRCSRKVTRLLPAIQKGLSTTPGLPHGTHDHFRPTGRASR